MRRQRRVAVLLGTAILLLCLSVGYLLGASRAPTKQETGKARAQAFTQSNRVASRRATGPAHQRAETIGRWRGRRAGARTGRAAGRVKGVRAAQRQAVQPPVVSAPPTASAPGNPCPPGQVAVGDPYTCETPNTLPPSAPGAQKCYDQGLLPTPTGCQQGE
jgi:hypothetical protein